MGEPASGQAFEAASRQAVGSGRVRLGQLEVDRLTFGQALDAIDDLVKDGRGGTVFTPNVDHVVLAEHDHAFRACYRKATLRLADGMPLVWASRLYGDRVPEKVSGSDLILPLMRRAAERGWRVFLLGAGPGVGEKAALILRTQLGVNVAGVAAPMLTGAGTAAQRAEIVAQVRATAPDLVVVGFGAPKQELFIDAVRADLPAAVLLGLGACIDFIAGNVPRAPPWMSRNGLEWLYRLCREPRRLWRRYLLRDPQFARILWRGFWERRMAGALPAGETQAA